MNDEFSFRFDRRLARNALKRDHYWRPLLSVGLLVMVLAAYRVYVGSFHPVVVGVAGLGMVVVVGRFVITFRNLVEHTFQLWSRQSPSGAARIRLDDDGFSLEMDRATSRYDWSDLCRLWRYRDVWLIEIVKNQSVVFPPDDASQEIRDFIVERCRSVGVRV